MLYIKITIYLIIFLLPTIQVHSAEQLLAEKLKGKILLQVEQDGKAWYVDTYHFKRYSMGRPGEAFNLMRGLGLGITNEDLSKIPVGLIDYTDNDDDGDGLPNRLETALGTNTNNKDSDGDGFSDKEELLSDYDPLNYRKMPLDKNFIQKNLGKIFLQTERNGEAWYINPNDGRRYYLGSPTDAFRIMQKLALGITNHNIEKIIIGYINTTKTKPSTNNDQNTIKNTTGDPSGDSVIQNIAGAIRENNLEKTLDYFTPQMQTSIEYSMKHLTAEQKFTLANILSGSQLTESSADKKTYTNKIYFEGQYHTAYFYVSKELNGNWYLSNL